MTPYLVQPVSDGSIKLPTDGYNAPSDMDRLLFNRNSDGDSGGSRPMPRAENNVSYTPATPGFIGAANAPAPAAPAKGKAPKKKKEAKAKSAPGFSF